MMDDDELIVTKPQGGITNNHWRIRLISQESELFQSGSIHDGENIFL